MKNSRLLKIVVISILLFVFNVPTCYSLKTNNILFISAYAPDYYSFNNQLRGVKAGFGSDYNFQIEYMNSKQTFNTLEDEKKFYKVLKTTLDNYNDFEGVVLADDRALEFGIKHKDDLFKNLPMVFMAANDPTQIEKAKSLGISGVFEHSSLRDNLNLIKKLNPGNDKTINLLTGSYLNYHLVIDDFLSLHDKFLEFKFNYIPLLSKTKEKTIKEIKKLDPDKNIIFLVYPYRDNPYNINFEDEFNSLFKDTNIPIYTSYNYNIKGDVIGGKSVNFYDQGYEAATLLKEKIKSPSSDAVVKDVNSWIFDYNTFKKYKINPRDLPEGSTLLNKPIPFFVEYKEIILFWVTMTSILMSIITLLLAKTKKDKKYQEQLMLSQQLAIDANETKNNFISTISHELRTPVTIISSSSQLLRKNQNNITPYGLNKSLDIIDQNANRLIRLINNIIDIAKFNSGFDSLNVKNLDVIMLIENTTLSVIPFAKSKNIDIIFDTSIEELTMSLDDEKIERVILNLLSNAIKFSNENDFIFVSIYKEDDNLVVIVQDTGVGIDKDNLDIIFDKFTQLSNTHTRYNEGSGIGLSIVKSFIDLHDGKIDVSSTLGVGTIFTIYLPIRITEVQSSMSSNHCVNANIELSDIIR